MLVPRFPIFLTVFLDVRTHIAGFLQQADCQYRYYPALEGYLEPKYQKYTYPIPPPILCFDIYLR